MPGSDVAQMVLVVAALAYETEALQRREHEQIIDAGCAANFVYRLSSAGEGALGKLEIRWRSQLGDSGRLQTQQILAAPALSRDASLAAISLPAVRPRWLAAARHSARVIPTCKPLLSICGHAGCLRCLSMHGGARTGAKQCCKNYGFTMSGAHQAAVTRNHKLVPWQSVPVEQPFPVRLRVQSRVNASFRRLHLCAPAPAAAAAPGGAPPAVVLQVPAARSRSGTRVTAALQATSSCTACTKSHVQRSSL